MKVSPIASGGTPGTSLTGSSERSVSAEKLAAAKAIAAGDSSIKVFKADSYEDPQVARAQRDIRKIKMRTNASPDRFDNPLVEPESVKSDDIEPVVEETKPLAPQFVALRKQQRALQVKERELADREKALESKPTMEGGEDFIARLKSSPLRVLQENGVTYQQLTDEILANPEDAVNPKITELEAKIAALEEGVNKNFVERDASAKNQVLAEMRKEAEDIAATDGEAFEAIGKRKAIPKVIELIDRTYESSGEILEVREAMQLVEDALVDEAIQYADLNKVKSRQAPTPQAEVPQRQNTLRTLTNRDASGVVPSRRDRALMAAMGTLTKG